MVRLSLLVNSKTNTLRKKGFTLLELIVVVVVIGILATTLISRLVDVQSRTRDAARQVAIRDISNALEMYAADNGGVYPKANFTTKNSIQQRHIALIPKAHADGSGTTSIHGIKDILQNYMRVVPQDPKTGLITNSEGTCVEEGKDYSYYTDSEGKMYAITSTLESSKGNTTNCKGVIDKNGDGDFIVVGKGLIDKLRPPVPASWYNGIGDPYERCRNNMTPTEADGLNQLIIQFAGSPHEINDRCDLQSFSLHDGTFGIQIPTNQNAGQKIEVPSGFNKLVGLQILDLSAGTINIAHLTFPMFHLKSIHLDGNKHLKELILPNSFPNLEEFVLQDSLLSTVTFPKIAPSLRRVQIYDTNLKILTLPDDISSLVELRINSTKLQTIILPAEMPNLQILDLTNNKFVAPLPASTCALLESKGWTSSTYIDNYNKMCK